jgi:hypothetical protein
MKNFTRGVVRFFKVIINPQAYINLAYSLASFPLGIFYFVFLVSGLALGVSLVIVWVGLPILLFIGLGCLTLGSFERFMAIHLLKENVPAFIVRSKDREDKLSLVKENLTNPVFLKTPFYLFLKFPLGIASFVVLVTLISLTVAFLTLPFTYETVEYFGPGIFLGSDELVWHIDSTADAALSFLVGLLLWPVTLQVTNLLTWVQAKFARIMLSADPMGGFEEIPKFI